jgi:hypothetical protein
MRYISESLLAIVDKGNRNLKIIGINNDKITSNVLLSSPPYDITVVPDDKLAVTLPEEKKIQFLSIVLPKVDVVTPEKSLTVSGACHGIDFIRNERKLIVTYLNPGTVEILDLDGTVDRTIDLNVDKVSVIPNTTLAYISKKENRMSVSLVILDFKDELENVCEISNTYRYVQGITTDKTGTAYICDEYSVYVTSNVGLYKNTLQSTDVETEELIECGYLSYARSVAFCDRTFRLYIGTKGKKIKVFSVA